MKERESDALDRALEAALGRTLTPPGVPTRFRAALQIALGPAGDSGLSDARSQLERDSRERLAELEQNYVRLKRRTLGTLIGGAFAAGASAAVVLPWITALLGPIAPLVIASTGTVIGIWIGVAAWLQSRADDTMGAGAAP
jgi:hypothetical protein